MNDPRAATTPNRRRIVVVIVTLAVVGLVGCIAVVAGVIAFRGGTDGKLYWIPSEAMKPTFQVNDRVHVDSLGQHDTVQRGWVVIHEAPASVRADSPDIEVMIKRVVGLPGETIEVRNGVMFIDDRPITEPYLELGNETPPVPKATLDPDKYFVMGDNRTNSLDSRMYGPVDRAAITGHVTKIIWPMDRRTSDLQ